MQNQFLHFAKKYATTIPKIVSLFVQLYISDSYILQQGWHIFIFKVHFWVYAVSNPNKEMMVVV